jgi:hypothetical protein
MDINYSFGPDKIPFSINNNGVVESFSAAPFHGIISRGLLNQFIANNLDLQLWHQYAHELHGENDQLKNQDLEKIRHYKDQCMVLSFGQSAFCARKYLEQYCDQLKLTDPVINLINIKEGHTSSVWKVEIKDEEKTQAFVLNIARDYEAGIELKESSEKMRTISAALPEINLAKVHDIFTLKEPSLPSEVIISRNEWVENSFEIHSRTSKVNGEAELLMVERFIVSKTNPAQITSVLGKIFSPEKKEKIQSEINDFIIKATTCLSSKLHVNINDGDVVWDGTKAVIVALS